MSSNLLDDILPSQVRVLDELRALVGPLSPTEKELLAQPMLYADPTEEELERLGSDFVGRVVERAVEKLLMRV